jgi:hypothetical protein
MGKEKFASIREIRGWFSHLLLLWRLPKFVSGANPNESKT